MGRLRRLAVVGATTAVLFGLPIAAGTLQSANAMSIEVVPVFGALSGEHIGDLVTIFHDDGTIESFYVPI